PRARPAPPRPRALPDPPPSRRLPRALRKRWRPPAPSPAPGAARVPPDRGRPQPADGGAPAARAVLWSQCRGREQLVAEAHALAGELDHSRARRAFEIASRRRRVTARGLQERDGRL